MASNEVGKFRPLFILSFLLLFIHSTGRKHRLTLKDEARKSFELSKFGFLKNGFLKVEVSKMVFRSAKKGMEVDQAFLSRKFGFSLEKTASDGISPYMEQHAGECILKDQTNLQNRMSVAVFIFDLKNKSIIVQRFGPDFNKLKIGFMAPKKPTTANEKSKNTESVDEKNVNNEGTKENDKAKENGKKIEKDEENSTNDKKGKKNEKEENQGDKTTTVVLHGADPGERNAVLDEVKRLLCNKDFSPFHFEKDFIKIISGQEEALYGWITVNFLKGVFSQKSRSTYGALDLGGASTQNTFGTKKDSALVTFEPILAGKTYPVFAHSYLSYGVDQARQSYLEYQASKQDPAKEKIVSFCHNDGYQHETKISEKNRLVVGKYNGVFCKNAIKYRIFCQDPSVKKCPFISQPKLKGNFYGFGAIYFALRDVKLLTEDDEVVTLAQIKNSTDFFCAKPVDDLDTSMFDVFNLCFQLNYIYELMKDGYNAQENGFTLHVAKDLRGFELNWVLGAMLKATNLL